LSFCIFYFLYKLIIHHNFADNSLDFSKALVILLVIVYLNPFFSKAYKAVVVVPSGDVISFLNKAGCKLDLSAYIIVPKMV